MCFTTSSFAILILCNNTWPIQQLLCIHHLPRPHSLQSLPGRDIKWNLCDNLISVEFLQPHHFYVYKSALLSNSRRHDFKPWNLMILLLKEIQQFTKRDSVISVNQEEEVQQKGKFILRNFTVLHKTQLYYYLSNTWSVNMYSLHVWTLINDCNVTKTNWITLLIDFDFIIHCSVPMHSRHPVHHHLQITSVCPTDFFLSSLFVPKASDGSTTQLKLKQFKDANEQRHALFSLLLSFFSSLLSCA